ncbi:MAG: hypothetical protein ACR2P0_07960 [Acidimicrobiales bacterium]
MTAINEHDREVGRAGLKKARRVLNDDDDETPKPNRAPTPEGRVDTPPEETEPFWDR